jgi:exodeoxyribonuclease V alpha subunit
LVEAVPRTAHLILLGDKDQLASVEAGAIFGDIYNAEADHRYSPALCNRVAKMVNTELPATDVAALPADSTIHLARSYRYDPSSSIASLARAVREGDAESAFLALNSGNKDVTWLCPAAGMTARAPRSSSADLSELEQTLRDGYAPFVAAEGPQAKLAALAKFRILSPHRQGRLGVSGLNALAEKVLCAELNAGQVHHYPGRPIMVTANDYQMDLFNGDIGVVEFRSNRIGCLF